MFMKERLYDGGKNMVKEDKLKALDAALTQIENSTAKAP